MSIPATPLVVQLSKQIEKEISAFFEHIGVKHLPAEPETVAMLTERVREHFQTNAITLSIGSTNFWEPKKLNIEIGDKYILRRLRDINSDEYTKVTCWMMMKGFDVPELDDGPLPYCSTDSNMSVTIYGADVDSEFVNPDPKAIMAKQILEAEGERQRFIRRHMGMGDYLTEVGTEIQSPESSEFKIFDSDASEPYEPIIRDTSTSELTIFGANVSSPIRKTITPKNEGYPTWLTTF
ncbi:MAG: hypothetical protein NC548_05885 [Lachnospiraceae bacterium]|nr:hypothetical protein [Lachnospiraceae bacterium]